MKQIKLKGEKKDIIIGYPNPIVVNVNVGVSNESLNSYNLERDKILQLSKLESTPDLMMDLSLNHTNGYLYDLIINEIGCPVGYIPHYTCKKNNGRIELNSLLDTMYQAAESGIAWFVLHLTPNRSLVKLAIEKRIYPFASRSAVIEIEDMIKSGREESIYWEIIDEIVTICNKYSIAISLGAAFRPGIMMDALDEVHIAELERYREITDYFQTKGVSCFIEGMGHCNVAQILKFNTILDHLNVPFMPLGPLFTDSFNKDDHIINAMSFYTGIVLGGKYSVINSITPSEHSGGIPDINEIITGYNAAKTCARLCNEFQKCRQTEINNICLNKLGESCSRCMNICPNQFYFKNKEQIESWINLNSK